MDPIKNLEKTFLQTAQDVHTEKWQGVDIKEKPEAQMKEMLFASLKLPVPDDLESWRKICEPHEPWATDHMNMERLSGQPLNPGKTWEYWPWTNSADTFRDEDKVFDHSYAERFWPKYANMTKEGKIEEYHKEQLSPIRGIRDPYGDLQDVVDQLKREPDTRQAYLPVWFPEDTGVVHGRRVPCSLGYHFIQRRGHLHVVYNMRSCDICFHMRDDIFHAGYLLLWILDQVREEHSWMKPGFLDMHMTSLHTFVNNFRELKAKFDE